MNDTNLALITAAAILCQMPQKKRMNPFILSSQTKPISMKKN